MVTNMVTNTVTGAVADTVGERPAVLPAGRTSPPREGRGSGTTPASRVKLLMQFSSGRTRPPA
ncbi:hypothetical protein LUX57_34105 [Actinomadura madurae]|uniref:hypothetical protein n=1 Tax=Actinomadura madurae TaxID=1993 RepID=UPI0020D25C0E|nr:hypothetical protein [Actinomadura madurae]MCP9969601.1 hypothetical protein [Actinomadura madurae]